MYNDESEFSKMKLPEGLLTNYKIAWGRFVAIRLDNAPDCDTMSFRILLDMKEREILGKADEGNNYRRWFDEREVGIYHDFVSLESYDGVATISGGNDEDTKDWKISCHTGYDELWEGELPNDIDWVGKIVRKICCKNTVDYFNNFE